MIEVEAIFTFKANQVSLGNVDPKDLQSRNAKRFCKVAIVSASETRQPPCQSFAGPSASVEQVDPARCVVRVDAAIGRPVSKAALPMLPDRRRPVSEVFLTPRLERAPSQVQGIPTTGAAAGVRALHLEEIVGVGTVAIQYE